MTTYFVSEIGSDPEIYGDGDEHGFMGNGRCALGNLGGDNESFEELYGDGESHGDAQGDGESNWYVNSL